MTKARKKGLDSFGLCIDFERKTVDWEDTTVNIKQWIDKVGGACWLMLRLHGESETRGAMNTIVPADESVRLRGVRDQDTALQGLSKKGGGLMRLQGGRLGSMGILPSVILWGGDQRNKKGAELTAEGVAAGDLSKRPPVVWQGALARPVELPPDKTAEAKERWKDFVIHAAFAGRCELWEPPKEYLEHERILAAKHLAGRVRDFVEEIIRGRSPYKGLVVADTIIEILVAAYIRYGPSLPVMTFIQYEWVGGKSPWFPTAGGGIIISPNGVAAEFDEHFQVTEFSAAKAPSAPGD